MLDALKLAFKYFRKISILTGKFLSFGGKKLSSIGNYLSFTGKKLSSIGNYLSFTYS
jgi:hypothetical protein